VSNFCIFNQNGIEKYLEGRRKRIGIVADTNNVNNDNVVLENIPASPDPDNTNDEEAQLLNPSSTTGGPTSIPPLSSLDKYGVHFRPLANLYKI